MSEDIRKVMAHVLEAKDARLMSAALTKVIINSKIPEAKKALAAIIPKEYIAAAYIALLEEKLMI